MKKNKRQFLNEKKEHLEKLVPEATSVDIKVSRTNDMRYKTRITVDIPGISLLVSSKSDYDFNECLDKNFHATVRQIHKLKTKRNRNKSFDLSTLVAS